jgi:hypothetical protein
MIRQLPLPAILLLICAMGCSTNGQQGGGNEETKPIADDRPVLQSIALRRVGGVAGFDDRILINAQGEAITSGRAFGMRYGRLSDEQSGQLATLFTGFDQLSSAYPPPPGVRDDLQYQVTYGGKVIRASFANEQLPEQLRAIVQELEKIAMSLPAR